MLGTGTVTLCVRDAYSDSAFDLLDDVLGRGLLPVRVLVRDRHPSVHSGVLCEHIHVVLAIEQAAATWLVRQRKRKHQMNTHAAVSSSVR